MENREQILQWLAQEGVTYELVEHPPAATMEDLVQFGVAKQGVVCKNLFLRDSQKGKRHYLVTVCGDKPVDLKRLGEVLGDRLSFASEKRLLKYLNLQQGSVTPLGVFYDDENTVKVFFDEEIQKQDRVGVHPGENTATVFLRPDDLAALVKGRGNALKWVSL